MTGALTGKYLFRLSILIILLLLAAEGSLRLLPASDSPYTKFDKAFSILKFDPDRQNEGFQTSGNLAQRKTFWRVNNMGWNSPYDYHPRDGRQTLAIIGNSYVEGLRIDIDKGLAASLQNRLGARFRCYGFGYSGAKLSQYLNISRYVQRTFRPKIMILTLFEPDVLGSLAPPDQEPQYALFFKDSPSGIVETPVREFVPSRLKRWYAKLGFIRYFASNKQAAFAEPSSKTEWLTRREIDLYERVSDYAFRKIRTENPDTTVLIVMDAPRRDIYRGRILEKRFQARTILSCMAKRHGLHFLDLTPSMQALYRENHISFSYSNDYHWNEHGFDVVAKQIAEHLAAQGFLE